MVSVLILKLKSSWTHLRVLLKRCSFVFRWFFLSFLEHNEQKSPIPFRYLLRRWFYSHIVYTGWSRVSVVARLYHVYLMVNVGHTKLSALILVQLTFNYGADGFVRFIMTYATFLAIWYPTMEQRIVGVQFSEWIYTKTNFLSNLNYDRSWNGPQIWIRLQTCQTLIGLHLSLWSTLSWGILGITSRWSMWTEGGRTATRSTEPAERWQPAPGWRRTGAGMRRVVGGAYS